jgi:hypothetical protein
MAHSIAPKLPHARVSTKALHAGKLFFNADAAAIAIALALAALVRLDVLPRIGW